MVSFNSIACSIPAGATAAVGSLAFLAQSAKAAKNAYTDTLEGGVSKTSFQNGLDRAFGKAESQTSVVARHTLEAVAYAVPALLLANLSISIFDPKAETVPHQANLGAGCGDVAQPKYANQTMTSTGPGYFQQFGDVASSAQNAAQGAFNNMNEYLFSGNTSANTLEPESNLNNLSQTIGL